MYFCKNIFILLRIDINKYINENFYLYYLYNFFKINLVYLLFLRCLK